MYFSLKYSECLYQNQKYKEALEVLNPAKGIVADPELFLLMGNAFINIGEFSKAKLSFEEAGYMVPGRILPKYYLTKLYFDTGENEKANSLVNKIMTMEIKIKSDTTLALINKIITLQKIINNKQLVEGAMQGHITVLQ
jgi:tetratricopeptide (TPR) repeat protein